MAKYRKIPVVIEANQWKKNGDHPLDHDPIGYPDPTEMEKERYAEYLTFEGQVVRYYRTPDIDGQSKCKHCKKTMHVHGWIDTLEGGHIVCPNDFIITGVEGEHYPCKPDIFAKTYEKEALSLKQFCKEQVAIHGSARERLGLKESAINPEDAKLFCKQWKEHSNSNGILVMPKTYSKNELIEHMTSLLSQCWGELGGTKEIEGASFFKVQKVYDKFLAKRGIEVD